MPPQRICSGARRPRSCRTGFTPGLEVLPQSRGGVARDSRRNPEGHLKAVSGATRARPARRLHTAT
eukprot:scaffold4569_cov117-Isochrysis_galbana.AAC.7